MSCAKKPPKPWARIAKQEAEVISQQLNSVTQLTDLYRHQTALIIATPPRSGIEPANRYRLDANGVYHTYRDDGGSALFYSGRVPTPAKDLEKVRRSAALDPLMKQIKAVNPLVVQSYFNTHDSLNRIYPYMDTSQYPAKMDITTYNFYYEADASHNPTRKPVWTDVYLDPAGQGWLASCIAPVYRGDFLEGVVGLDVTVSTIIQQVLALQLPWGAYAMLVGKDGSILALPPAGEQDFGLSELVSHQYRQAVGQDTFKPDEFNLYKRPQLKTLAAQLTRQASGLAEATISGRRLVAWHRVEETGWTMLVIATPANIFSSAISLSERLEKISYAMIAALLVFYVLFFIGLFVRARIASRTIAQPLKKIERMMLDIGQGHYEQTPPAVNVTELHATARELSAMGRDLGAAHRALLATQRQLQEHVSWLDTVFQLSPDGLVTFDQSAASVRAIRRFSHDRLI
jgi:HAMP domain-containing protein